jgi:membrane associated rhomboid family serine protease
MRRKENSVSPGPRKPIFNLPGVILLVLAVLVLAHLARVYILTDAEDSYLLRAVAFVPAQFTFIWNPDAVAGMLTDLAREGRRGQLLMSQFFLGVGRQQWWTPLSYALLHADWTHLGVNSLWLVAFGAPVAVRFGALRFLAFFAVTAAAGAGAHYWLHMADATPVIGASAAVSGLTAAALRFVFQPGAPLGPVPFYGPLPPDLAARQPALPISRAWRDRRVLQFAAIWFAVNLLVGLFAVPLGIAEFGVAWEAHAGGFVAGFLFFSLFDPPHRGVHDPLPRMTVP